MPVKNDVNLIKKNFTKVLTDGKVSDAEAKKLCTSVATNKVTQSERRQFRELYYQNKDKFDATAQKRMDDFIENKIPTMLIPDEDIGGGGTGTVKDPDVLKEDKNTLKWSAVNGSLFVDGVNGDDVQQGQIGDCYFAAAMAEVAHTHPEAIEKMFTKNADGTLNVRFWEQSGSGYKPVDVKIDGDLPLAWGGLRYAHARDNKELWVPLLEKAYAQWKGGYEAIGAGGNPGDVMTAITGKGSDYNWVSPSTNTDKLFKTIQDAMKAGKSAAAVTYGEHSSVKYDGTGVYADHTYSIWGVSEENGKKFIQLRNPWGEVEWTGEGKDTKDDGIFKMPMSEFIKYYEGVDIVG
jgi:hypothetical protein